MGITNLLPQLASVSHELHFNSSNTTNVRETSAKRQKNHKINYRRTRVGVDVSTWISSACHSNGAELIDDRHFTNYGRAELYREEKMRNGNSNGESEFDTSNQIEQEQLQHFIKRATNSVLRKISSLQDCLSADILIVLDGASPPIKKKCCDQRVKARNEAATKRDMVLGSSKNPLTMDVDLNDVEEETLKRSLAKISAAKKAGAHTREIYTAVVVSLLKCFREKRIPFLVAPYEADGQLAYFSKEGMIDLIVSEDSDFIGHGAKTILYKFKEVYIPYENFNKNKFSSREATGVLIRRRDLEDASADPSFDLTDFTDVMLALLCVAAGCDYCDSLRGIGIITARNSVFDAFRNDSSTQKAKHQDTPKLEKLFSILFRQCYATLSATEKNVYIKNFLSALIMFRHPIVFNPISASCMTLNIDNPDNDLMEFEPYATIINNKEELEKIAGKKYCKKMSIYVAEGWVNPKTWSLWNSESETPTIISKSVEKWNTLTHEIENDFDDENEENIDLLQNDTEMKDVTESIVTTAASQTSNGTNSASKLSSQTSNRSSNISVMSPNLLSLMC
mmetsp:Transcript_28321/g.35009  ORF Transcript_28321/g.35009 Transcript_28321/m.35009 type:complete len:565 (+) Transcript_28321:50-1744(+)